MPGKVPYLPPFPSPLADLDADGDGVISSSEMVALLRNKLPQAEVGAAAGRAAGGVDGGHAGWECVQAVRV
jgi:hypothetical protein